MPSEVQRVLLRYESLGGQRELTGLGGFLRRGLELVTLTSVDDRWREHALVTKHLFILWNALLDDVVDSRKDARLADRMLAVPFRDEVPRDISKMPWMTAYADLWLELKERFSVMPRYPELKDFLTFDIRQFLNGLRYGSLLASFQALVNTVEHRLYLPHSMNLMIFATLDLMASPDFDLEELAVLREIATHAQWMALLLMYS